MKFVLSTDSCCDLFKSTLSERGIECLAMSYCFERPVYDTFDSEEEYAAFYDRLRAGGLPTTSQSNMVECTEHFELLTKQHPNSDIVHLVLSSGLSGSFDTAQRAADEMNERIGCKRIYCVDSLAATQGQAMQLELLADCRDKEMTADETVRYIADIRDRQHHFILASDLFHLYRGGRLSLASAAIASALRIKPVIVIDSKGKLHTYEKIIGVKKVMKYFIQMLTKMQADFSLPVYIAHSDPELAKALIEMLHESYPEIQPKIGWIGPVIGSHTGPGTLGLVFVATAPRLAFDK